MKEFMDQGLFATFTVKSESRLTSVNSKFSHLCNVNKVSYSAELTVL